MPSRENASYGMIPRAAVRGRGPPGRGRCRPGDDCNGDICGPLAPHSPLRGAANTAGEGARENEHSAASDDPKGASRMHRPLQTGKAHGRSAAKKVHKKQKKKNKVAQPRPAAGGLPAGASRLRQGAAAAPLLSVLGRRSLRSPPRPKKKGRLAAEQIGATIGLSANAWRRH